LDEQRKNYEIGGNAEIITEKRNEQMILGGRSEEKKFKEDLK
jgi:hypothetical protein